MENDNSGFFVNSDSEDSEGELDVFKRRKIEYGPSQPEDTDSEDDWENVPLVPPKTDEELIIEIRANKDRQRRLQSIKEKKYRISLHYLSMITYTAYAYKRNMQLNHPKVLKRLKKLIPQKLMKSHIKKLSQSEDPDKSLIYILKYLVKWFRLNFKCESSGLRVLGYLPKKGIAEDYFPSSTPINDHFKSIIKKFGHNRDTGAQVFTALLRSLGWNSRLVFSLPLLPTNDYPLQPKLNKQKLAMNKDNDLLYPYFWTELVNPLDDSEIIVLETMCFHNEDDRLTRRKRTGHVNGTNLQKYYCDLYCPKVSQFNKMTMHYVVALTSDNQLLDVTPRYKSGIAYRFFDRLDLRTETGRAALLYKSVLNYFKSKHQADEALCLKQIALCNYTIPTTFTAMKRNPNVVTKSTLRYNENILNSSPIAYIKIDQKKEPVYFKQDLIFGKSERQWKFLGRSINPSEIQSPVKSIDIMTSRTVYNRRLYELNKLNKPELNKVDLYSYHQTVPYIKSTPSFVEGRRRLPRNKYGNIEIYHDCMIPDDCEWLKLSNITSILRSYCHKHKTFDLDYVPVVIGFNFTQKCGQAIPVFKGIIAFKDDAALIKNIWIRGKLEMQHVDLLNRKRRSLALWTSFLRSLRIKKNLEQEYGLI